MTRFVIEGAKSLRGRIDVEANKNAVLPMMAACLLTDDDCVIENVPGIADVVTMTSILRELGAEVELQDTDRLRINCRNVRSFQPSPRLVERLRASIVLMGPLLARFGRVDMHHPGGDAIGTRSIGTHIHALQELGVAIAVEDNFYRATVVNGPLSRMMFLDEASVTATENAMLFAASRPTTTVIRNAASEPHIENLASMLVTMGVTVEGAGSNVLSIQGVDRLGGASARVLPDHIEAGTFAALAAACK